ncbi:hypothetical protein YB2330_003550 [Saitoella coloradoensis]
MGFPLSSYSTPAAATTTATTTTTCPSPPNAAEVLAAKVERIATTLLQSQSRRSSNTRGPCCLEGYTVERFAQDLRPDDKFVQRIFELLLKETAMRARQSGTGTSTLAPKPEEAPQRPGPGPRVVAAPTQAWAYDVTPPIASSYPPYESAEWEEGESEEYEFTEDEEDAHVEGEMWSPVEVGSGWV